MDAPCLDCGEPMVIVMRDEQVLTVEPDTIAVDAAHPAGDVRAVVEIDEVRQVVDLNPFHRHPGGVAVAHRC